MRVNNKRKTSNKFTIKMQASLLLVFCMFLIIFIILAIRLLILNNEKGDRYAKRVLSQQTYVSNVLPYKRGDILDRNGTVLARSEKVYNLAIDPKVILEEIEGNRIYVEPTINAIHATFKLEKEMIRSILEEKKDKRYVILQKGYSYDEMNAYLDYIESLKQADKENETDLAHKIKGVWFDEEYVRKYPLDSVASDVIGFTVNETVGNWGIEEYYNEYLNGTNGREYGYFDSELKLERTVKPAKNGDTIISTIDANIQNIIEKEIKKYNDEVGSKNTAVLVMNPQNGEIIAMASYPTYNLNEPRDLKGFFTEEVIEAMSSEEKLTQLNEIWRNYVISDTFEPGSTFKPFTIAASLDENVANDTRTYECDGIEEVLGVKIRCSKRAGHGIITLKEAMMYSCNDVLMQIAGQTGKNMFSKYQEMFGFGSKTGIDLPGEANGLVFNKEQLNPIELATSSFGQGETVTMVQMLSAFSSIINDGSYYRPHVVKEIVNENGGIVKNKEKILMKETTSKKTSELLREYMYQTVETGTAKGAKVPGYTIGGKTGTAEKVPRGQGNYLVSFIGFAPVYEPQIAIYVIVDEPNVTFQADSSIATKMAGRIMEQIFPFLNIYPTEGLEEVIEE